MPTSKNTNIVDIFLKNAVSKGLCFEEEYQAILDVIYQKNRAAKMLVFGTGPDCMLWFTANQKGIINFLEDNPVWIDRYSMLPNIQRIDYGNMYMDQHNIHSDEELFVPLGKLENPFWDIIFVDGPVGTQYGRMKSIYNAYRLAYRTRSQHPELNPVVFVHDYNRETEQLYVDHYFNNIEVINRLAKIQL